MKLLATLGAFLFSGVVAATPLHNAVVFGDSLSDNGNLYEIMKHQLPQSPPYYKGRFTNGPVWIEHLIASYFPENPQTHLLNYAIGGAGVLEEDGDDVLFTLRKEIDSYFLSHNDKANPDTLYIVWIGANNYLAMPSDVEQTLSDVNIGIAHGLERLADKGAKHILVLNLPDLAKTPAAIEFGSVETFSYYSMQHNKSLEQKVSDFKKIYPDVNWLFFDLNTAFNYVLEHPQEYGITNTTDTCVNSMVDEVTKKSVLRMVASTTPKLGPDACNGYLFFDLVHPTGLAHKIVSEKARLMLDEAGVQFSD